MAMHTDAALRFPAWLIAASVVVGVALGLWQVGVLQYWDRYVRIDGEWFFERRKFHRYYIVDALERPRAGAGLDHDPLTTTQLPEAWPSWGAFWERMGKDG